MEGFQLVKGSKAGFAVDEAPPGTFWIGASRGIGLADKCAARGLGGGDVWRF